MALQRELLLGNLRLPGLDHLAEGVPDVRDGDGLDRFWVRDDPVGAMVLHRLPESDGVAGVAPAWQSFQYLHQATH